MSFSTNIITLTDDLHKQSTATPIMQRYLQKKVTLKQHADYLLQQYYIFLALEQLIEQHQSHPIFKDSGLHTLIKNMNRSEVIQKNYVAITEKLNQLNATLTEDKLWPETVSLIKALKQHQSNPEKILAHAFVHYLALLNGGLIIKAKLNQTFSNLNKEALEFYTVKPSLVAVNHNFQRKVDTIAHLLNESDFLCEVEYSYQWIIKQMQHNDKALLSCHSTLFKYLPPIAAATAVGLGLATCYWRMGN